MSKKRFLPPSKQDEDHAVQSANGFIGQDHQFLSSLAGNMQTGSPQSTPRRPTPFSALWQFAADLEGKTGPTLQAAARRRLRGILSLLALRARENLAISCNVSPSFDQAANGIPFVDMLRRHLVHRSRQVVQDNRLIYLTLGGQVIAGYSPATLLFPAAKRVTFPPAARPTWFSEEHGEWLDPTSDSLVQIGGSEVKINPETIPENAGAIRVWLDATIAWLNQAGNSLERVLPNNNLLKSELTTWRQELDHIQPVGEIANTPMVVRGESTQSITTFVSAIVPLALTLEGTPPSALTLHNGRYLLSRDHLIDPNVRLVGNIHGDPAYGFRWANAGISGDHLGADLDLPAGEQDSLAIPFLFVDKLFTPSLSRLSDNADGHTTSPQWKALSSEGETYAYPLSIEALEFFSPSEIETVLSANWSDIDQQVSVSFHQGNFHFVKIYAISENGASPVVTLDPSLDFRLFPDYNLCDLNLKAQAKQLPAEEDRCYHARIRMSRGLAEIETQITPLFEDKNNNQAQVAPVSDFDRRAIGSLEKKSSSLYGSGRRLVLTIRPGQNRLCGFNLGDKGMLLLRLDTPDAPQGENPQSATVGIDFGTSNTCLSTLAGHGDPRVLIPDATTTSFLSGFTPAQREGSHEGYSADFDFFSAGSAKTSKLYTGSFFPTQLASRKTFQPGDFSESPKFDPLLALVCFESLSDFMRKDAAKVNTVANYDTKEGNIRDYQSTVYLKDRLKWDTENVVDTAFFRSLRRIFLQHLRLQLVHATAKSGTYISTVRASYPRAFTPFQADTFKSSLEAIWRHSASSYLPTVEIFTESLAASAFLRTQEKIDHFLIDIGGGTTDICVFSDGEMKGESSVRMAADIVDRYFLSPTSKVLRESFFDAWQSFSREESLSKQVKKDLKGRFLEAGEEDNKFEEAMVSRGLFYTFLALSNEEENRERDLIYRSLNEADVFDRAGVENFFTTLAVFYGGLAYLSGLMLKEKVAAGQMDGRAVNISFAGNGANHLAWLRVGNEVALEQFLGKMFRAGSGLPAEVASPVDILSEPKAAVALGLGLVSSDIGNRGEAPRESFVYNRVDGTWAGTHAGTLFELYTKEEPSEGWDFDRSEIKVFLKELAKATPDGRIGSRRITSNSSDDWAVELISDGGARNSMKQTIGNRMNVCKRTFARNIDARSEGLALEPIVVAELSGLLSILRNNQPNGR